MSNPDLLPLHTSRLLLRRFNDTDLDSFREYRNDPAVARYQGWEGCGLDEAKEFIERQRLLEAGVPGQWLQIAITLRTTNAHIGDCAFRVQANDPRLATVGITLASRYQRQGLACEAMTCLFDALFDQLSLHRIVADTDPENTASWNLLEQLGLRREGHLKQSLWFKGRWVNEYLYAILREEWAARRSKRHS